MSKMSTFDRMCRLREWLKEQDPRITEAAIERKMGVATNYFKTRANASIEEGEKSVREKTLNNLKAAWPEVNIEWVKTGEGSMFEEDHPVIVEGKGIHTMTLTSLAVSTKWKTTRLSFPHTS